MMELTSLKTTEPDYIHTSDDGSSLDGENGALKAELTWADTSSGRSSSEAENSSEKKLLVGSNKTDVATNTRINTCKIHKNLIVISIAFLLNFTAFQNMQNLQSSLNRVDGLGTVGLSFLYASAVISNLFLPSIVIKRLGCKWTMFMSFIPYTLYMIANFHATWYTIIPTSCLVGITTATLWTAKNTYLTVIGVQYAKLTGITKDAIISRFYGIFFMVFQTAQIWGNLISGFVLHEVPANGTLIAHIPDDILEQCGAGYCEKGLATNNTNLDRPDDTKVYALCGTYVALGVIAASTMAIMLDKLDKPDDDQSSGCSSRLLMATVKQMKNADQLLLIPITMYWGFSDAFIVGDFTEAYVSCTLGIWMVGLVLVCFGMANAIGAIFFGKLVQYTGRVPVMIIGALMNLSCFVTLLVWRVHPDQLPAFFAVAALLGLGDGAMSVQINALYGCLFVNNSTAAFSNAGLWGSLGWAIAFACSSHLCVSAKLYIVVALLALGAVGYFTVEFREARRKPVSVPD